MSVDTFVHIKGSSGIRDVFSTLSTSAVSNRDYVLRVNVTIDDNQIGFTLSNVTEEDSEDPFVLTIFTWDSYCDDYVTLFLSISSMSDYCIYRCSYTSISQ